MSQMSFWGLCPQGILLAEVFQNHRGFCPQGFLSWIHDRLNEAKLSLFLTLLYVNYNCPDLEAEYSD